MFRLENFICIMCILTDSTLFVFRVKFHIRNRVPFGSHCLSQKLLSTEVSGKKCPRSKAYRFPFVNNSLSLVDYPTTVGEVP